MKFRRNVLHVKTHRLTGSDFRFDVTLSSCRQWRHITKKCCHLVSRHEASAWQLMQQRVPEPYRP